MNDAGLPRGLRLNNPGNIRRSSIAWKGQAQPTDPDFVSFTSSHYGLRALALELLSYYRYHGLNTVRGLINRWAPPTDDNDTPAYVLDVAQRCGVKSDAPIKVDDPVMLARLCAAVTHHENGQQPYPSVTIANAVDDALGVHDAAPAGSTGN